MNDLGIAFTWLAVQVALVLTPAMPLHAWASRRGPAAGAWVATAALAMVVALSVATWPAGRLRRESTGPVAEDRGSSPPTAVAGAVVESARPPASGPARSWRLADLGLAWERIGREASAPAERCRPWGGVLAALATAGVALGWLGRLAPSVPLMTLSLPIRAALGVVLVMASLAGLAACLDGAWAAWAAGGY